MKLSTWFCVAALALPPIGCAMSDEPGSGEGEAAQDVLASAGAWYTLDAANGTGAATLSVANGRLVRCPNGHNAITCDVTALVLPASCGFGCQDSLLGLQGETLLQGHFAGTAFVIETGLDTWRAGLGTYSIYRIAAAPTCAMDPCPGSLTAKKINSSLAATTVTGIDFTQADDTNYVHDPVRGDAQASLPLGLYASGHIVSHKFRADRVWRTETPLPVCDPQQAALAFASSGGEEFTQFRTVAEAERAIGPDPEDSHVHWLVRTADSPTATTFTWGINDLWAVIYSVAKSDCAITVLGEH